MMGIIRKFIALGIITSALAACQNASEAPDSSLPDTAQTEEIIDDTDQNPLLNTGSLSAIGQNCSAGVAKSGRYKTPFLYDPCQENPDNHLLYVFLQRTIYVCENGKAIWANLVSGGKNGFRKERQGDKKVPEGIYTLGQPRPSATYGIFIPIDYPNAEDRKAGRTGGSVGIHGPTRRYACDPNNSSSSWTNGCLAYPTDRHVYELALWVKKNPDAYIELREK